jgi:LPXTG-motif cell wall-anchored protein
MMKKQSIKRMVLTGAAVTVMMSFAAPAMAQEVRDHRDGSGEAGPIVRDHRDGSGGILCSFFPASCEPPPYNVSDPVIPPVVNDPPDPVVDPPPKHCQVLPKGCKPPFGDTPVLDPVLDSGEDEDPVVTDPPDKEDPVSDPPDKEDPDKDEQPDTNGGSGGNSSGGSGGTGNSSGSATTGGGGSSGGSVSSASQTIDRGGTFVSSFLPSSLTTKMGDAGSAVKKNLPAPVAKSLPNTGGGWSFLVLIGAALIAGGFAVRTVMRRTTSVTRTAH